MEKKFRKEFGSLESIDRFVRSYASAHGLGAGTVFEVNFVIEELFTNMVKYQASADNDVAIELSGDGQTLTIRLTDFGVERFDPTSAPEVDTSKPLEERRPGGLGVHLVRRYVDEFTYEHNGKDSIITLVKHLKD